MAKKGLKMEFTEVKLKGAYIIDLDLIEDSRGFFSRCWCKESFASMGLLNNIAQCNISYNHKKGTLRGMHYQKAPYEETKLVRCIRGAIYDVIIDLRKESKTYKQWFGIELTSENRKALYIPKGFAHGYLTLEDKSEIMYQVTEFYHPEAESAVAWNDPTFSIEWPMIVEDMIISEKDRKYKFWKE